MAASYDSESSEKETQVTTIGKTGADNPTAAAIANVTAAPANPILMSVAATLNVSLSFFFIKYFLFTRRNRIIDFGVLE